MVHEEVSKMLSKQHFQLELVQELQDSSRSVTPDVFTIDDTGIESLISWGKPPFNQFKCFLTFNKVKTNTINWQVHKIIVDITNITKVSLDQDFKTFFISQEFVVDIQEESFFFSCQIFNKGWLIELNTSRYQAQPILRRLLGKLPQSCLQSLLLSHHLQSQIIEGM